MITNRFFLKFIILVLASGFVFSGCGWEDATTSNTTNTTTGVASISFVSATPTTIVTKGYGTASIPETSKFIFKVLDEKNVAVQGANISFSLSDSGASLGVTLSSTSAITDANGLVEVVASSGSQVATFYVNALYNNKTNEISTKSESVTIIKKSDLVKSISFESASSTTIAVSGNGSSLVPDYTDLKFLLLDGTGSPVTGASVVWYLPNNGGGITLSSQTGVSDANGEITVRANAGTSITTFEVWVYPETSTSIKQKSSLITITSNKVKAISFISGVPTLIALKGTGGSDITETSKLTFKAVDETGIPVVGAAIKFDLSTRNGGITFATMPDQNGLVTGKTNPDGIVSINVISGTVPTSVNITATVLSDPTIWSISNPINVSTGRPTQETFSVAPEKTYHAIGAWSSDGIEKNVIARAYDRFHHPVPDGTVLQFRTEWGGIESYCKTQNGTCSVKWWSSGSRYFIEKQDTPGRVTINASVMGEEGFVDIDGDGLFTSNDYLAQPWNADAYDIGELFVNNVEIHKYLRSHDDLANGQAPVGHVYQKFDSGLYTPVLGANVDPANLPDNNSLKWKWIFEGHHPVYDLATDEFFDDNGDGVRNPGNGIYNGVLCSDEAQALGYCSKKLVRVGVENVIIATPTNPVTTCIHKIYDSVTGTEVVTLSAGSYYVFEFSDSNGNSLPEGTKITFNAIDASGGDILPSPLDYINLDIPDTSAIGFGATLFNQYIGNPNVPIAAIKISIAGAGTLQYKVPVL